MKKLVTCLFILVLTTFISCEQGAININNLPFITNDYVIDKEKKILEKEIIYKDYIKLYNAIEKNELDNLKDNLFLDEIGLYYYEKPSDIEAAYSRENSELFINAEHYRLLQKDIEDKGEDIVYNIIFEEIKEFIDGALIGITSDESHTIEEKSLITATKIFLDNNNILVEDIKHSDTILNSNYSNSPILISYKYEVTLKKDDKTYKIPITNTFTVVPKEIEITNNNKVEKKIVYGVTSVLNGNKLK